MNCHISEIRTGNTSDVFDQHVIECQRIHNVSIILATNPCMQHFFTLQRTVITFT